MEKHIRVSGIMGIYNCENTLQEAMESLLNQTYTDWGLIMCDDGSVDKTYEIASVYAQKYDNIYLLKNEKNKGLNYTLNRCLEHASGEYIARMDGDDISLPDRFEKEVQFLEANPQYALVSTAAIYFDENGKWSVGNVVERPEKQDFAKNSPFCHPAAMIRKSMLDEVEGYTVDERLLRVEDYHLWVKIYEKGGVGYNIPEALYMLRDDRAAVKRRRFKYRMNEVYVKYLAIKKLNLPLRCCIYLLRPILVGILPKGICTCLHRIRLKNKENQRLY